MIDRDNRSISILAQYQAHLMNHSCEDDPIINDDGSSRIQEMSTTMDGGPSSTRSSVIDADDAVSRATHEMMAFYFTTPQPVQKQRSSREIARIQRRCERLMALDYRVLLIENTYCRTYPLRIVVPVAHKTRSTQQHDCAWLGAHDDAGDDDVDHGNDDRDAIELDDEAAERWRGYFADSSVGRARKRFCAPVLLVPSPLRQQEPLDTSDSNPVDNTTTKTMSSSSPYSYLFRSAGLVQKLELSHRYPLSKPKATSRSSVTDLSQASVRNVPRDMTFKTKTRDYLTYGSRREHEDELRAQAGKAPKPESVKVRKGKTQLARSLDCASIYAMGVKYISDLMVEDLLKLHGLSLVGSEKVHSSASSHSLALSLTRSLQKSDRYRYFLINATPMPGIEYFSTLTKHCSVAAATAPHKSMLELLDEAVATEPIEWASVSVSLCTTFDHSLLDGGGSWLDYRSWNHST